MIYYDFQFLTELWQCPYIIYYEIIIAKKCQLNMKHADISVHRLKSGMFELKIKTHKNGVFSSISDVGFGVSKLLPILVADIQLSTTSLLAISEPEIDLHPTIQADFADYIIRQATTNHKQYIVETHSEYFLNRIRLLIAKGELNEEDVKVYFFDNNGKKTEAHSIVFKRNGEIVGAPENFFKTYMVDTMQLALNSFDNEYERQRKQ